jgi:hypothetical protein
MPQRTPVIGPLPKVLLRSVCPQPTPVLEGIPVPVVSDVLDSGEFTEAELEAMVRLAGEVPEADPAWDTVYLDLLRSSCAYFASEKIRGPQKDPYNGKFLLGRHHLEWDQLIQGFLRLNILAARDHGKSFFFTMAYPIWKAGYNAPGSYGIIFSATQPQAEEFLAKIKEELLENPEFAHLVPYSRDRYWSAKRITLRNKAVIRAAGFGVKIRGGHPDWCVCDDVLNDDDIYSETIRRKNVDYFLSAIAGMVHVTDQLIVVGTPMHQADLYAVLADNEQLKSLLGDVDPKEIAKYLYECRSYPAVDPETGECLFPERYNERALLLKRIELKSAARYAREYLCQALSDEASLFPSKLFEGPEVKLPYVLGLPGSYWEKMGYLRYSGVDIAMSAETGADYFVIFTIAVSPNGVRYVANIRRGKGWSFTRQIDEIKEEYYLMRPEIIHIEANQMQRVWTDEVVRTTDLPVRKFFTTGVGGAQPRNAWRKGATQVAVNKHHIDRGVPGLRMLFEHKKWRIPRGDEYSIKETEVWIGEMGALGWIDGKVQSVGKHDDTVMACWMADTSVQMGNPMLDLLGVEDVELTDPASIMAAPIMGKNKDGMQDFLEAERHALAAIQGGKKIECTKDQYLSRIRSSLHDYADESADAGEPQRAKHASEKGGYYKEESKEDISSSEIGSIL